MKKIDIGVISKSFEHEVNVPGSKSYSLRALFLNELAEKPAKLHNLLESDDTRAMQKALAYLKNNNQDIYVNESGITARFITVLCCITPGIQKLEGAGSLNSRPIKDLVNALRSLGADIEYMDKEGFPPIKIKSSELKGSEVLISGRISSQYLSALLLVSPMLKNGLEINITENQVSKPYIDMTIDVMDKFGVSVINNDYKRYVIKPQRYICSDYVVESDYSSAAYFFALAALHESKIEVKNLYKDSKQADKNFLNVLQSMGAKVEYKSDSVVVTGNKLNYIDANMNNCPDQAMTAAVLASFAKGRSTIKGIYNLRLKESERIQAMQNELAKMGIKTRSKKDSLTIFGGKARATNIDTYNDHRLAMSFAVAATKISGLSIMNPDVTSKTFPDFWKELSKITSVKLENEEKKNILLIGMRGTGKSTTGRILAKKLGKDFVDMDKYIEEQENKKIRDIVIDKGWYYFRDLEKKASKNLCKYSNYVIASGGGIVLDPNNIQCFKPNSNIILINANPRVLSSRIRKDKNRLGLTNQPTLLGELSEVWRQREDMYYSACDFIVNSGRLNSKKVADQIVGKINSC